MKNLFWLLLLSCVPALSQTAAFNGVCSQGGTSAAVQGVQSTNKLAGIVPKCQVSVFLTGTTTPATIFADVAGTPLANPFYATALGSAAPGSWLFFAGTGQGYDVTMSNGTQTPVPGFPAGPVTLTDLIVTAGGGGGSGCTTTGAAGTLQGANGAGGCQPANVQVNGVNVPQSPNFTNSATVTFSNPSGNTVTATAAPTLTIQHNGVSTGIDQTLLNFNDTPPSIPSGNVPVTFQTNTAGLVSGTVPASGAGIQPQLIPPIAGQSVTIFPTSAVPTSGSSQNIVSIGQSLTSAAFSRPACGGGGGQPACDSPATSTVVWSGFQLPAGVSASSVTAIFAVAQAQNFNLHGIGGFAAANLGCQFPGGGSTNNLVDEQEINFPVQQFSASLSGATGSEIPSVTCTGSFTDLGSTINNGLNYNVNAIALIVYYTGSPVTQPNVVNVAPPLSFSPATEILGLSLPYNYAEPSDTSDAYAATVPAYAGLGVATGMEVLLGIPNFGSNTTTTPTFNLNGLGALTITKAPGMTPLAPGDMAAGTPCLSGSGGFCVADITANGIGWTLNNPQTSSGGGGGTSVSVNGASVTNPNFNGTTPAAPSGNTNCAWAVSGSSVSCSVPTSSGGGAVGGTLAIAAGTQAANSCAAVATVTDTGLTTSGAFSRPTIAYTGSTAGLTGWDAASPGMKVNYFMSAANTMGYEVCNYSTSSITYSAITFQLGAS